MRGSPGELLRERLKVEVIYSLKRPLSNLMLLQMVVCAQTDRPTIRRLQAHASVRASTNVRALYWKAQASTYRAAVAPYPRAMGSTDPQALFPIRLR